MMRSGVNLMPRIPAEAVSGPVTCGFNVSEGRLQQNAYPARCS